MTKNNNKKKALLGDQTTPAAMLANDNVLATF